MKKPTLIYDYETLGTDPQKSAVVSIAAIVFDEQRLINGPIYKYEDLVNESRFFKFDVADQVKHHGRVVEPDTLKWWAKQDKAALAAISPCKSDRSISEFPSWLTTEIIGNINIQKVYSRNNTFDPIFTSAIYKHFDTPVPYKFYVVRDTKSTIDGLAWGSDMRDSFVPYNLESKFIAHDPRHDIAMDIMRLQFLSQTLLGEDDGPPWD